MCTSGNCRRYTSVIDRISIGFNDLTVHIIQISLHGDGNLIDIRPNIGLRILHKSLFTVRSTVSNQKRSAHRYAEQIRFQKLGGISRNVFIYRDRDDMIGLLQTLVEEKDLTAEFFQTRGQMAGDVADDIVKRGVTNYLEAANPIDWSA